MNKNSPGAVGPAASPPVVRAVPGRKNGGRY
ncbi:MAG: hypothetical protein H6Q84_1953, partial [Deltaproteobacteria bacterium]|nr:hypothetical protein [Deltaproteobacteria bacterium]